MTTATFTPVEDLEPDATFSFEEDDRTLYVLVDTNWHERASGLNVELVYTELGINSATESHRTSHKPTERVRVWS